MQRRVLIVGGVFLAALAGHAVAAWVRAPSGVLAGLQLTVAAASVVVIVASVRVYRPRPVWPWAVIAATTGVWLAADIANHGFGAGAIAGFDLVYVVGYIGLFWVLGKVLRGRLRQAGSDSLIDGALVALATGYSVWVLVLEPAFVAAGAAPLEVWIAAVHPVATAAALVLIVQLLIVPAGRLVATGWLAAAGGAGFVASVIWVDFQLGTRSVAGVQPRLLDTLWLAIYVGIALAAAHPTMKTLVEPAEDAAGFRRARLAVIAAAVISMPVVYGIALASGDRPEPAGSLVVAGAGLPLILWRLERLRRQAATAHARTAARERHYRTIAQNTIDTYLLVDANGVIGDVGGPRTRCSPGMQDR